MWEESMSDGYDFIDTFPIRTELTVLPADEPKTSSFDDDEIIISSDGDITENNHNVTLGWNVYEEIGIAIVNPRAVMAGRKIVKI
jgi:hypothetical protein